MSVGKRIKDRRQYLGMTVDELAKKLNKNRATVYRYESAEIENLPLTILEPLAKALDVTPSYLMGWERATTTARRNSFIFLIKKKSLSALLIFHLGPSRPPL